MSRPNWAEIKDDFAWDGSLRDIYILDTDANDWDVLLAAIRSSNYERSYRLDGELAAEVHTGGDYEVGVAIHVSHAACLSLPIENVVLNDTQGVNPDISIAKILADLDCVFESVWKIRHIDPILTLA